MFRELRLPQDLSYLYANVDKIFPAKDHVQIENNIEIQNRFTYILEHQIQNIWMIEDTNKLSGLIYSYECNMIDGHCKIHFFNVNDELINEFCSYIFREYPIHSIFIDTLEDLNIPGFNRVCELSEYIYQDGKYKDLHVYCKSRE